MSNSFNISVKPEIAALEAKVDTVDTVVDSIKAYTLSVYDFTGVVYPKLPTNYLMGSSVESDKDDEIDAIKERSDRLPDAPADNALLTTNETKIVIIDGIVDAIKLKTDLLPQFSRGTFTPVGSWTASDTYITIVDVTNNSGKLLFIALKNGSDTNLTFRLTIDGHVSNELTHNTVDLIKYVVPAYTTSNILSITMQDNPFTIPFEFSTSLKLEYKRTAGASNPSCSTAYNLD